MKSGLRHVLHEKLAGVTSAAKYLSVLLWTLVAGRRVASA